MRTIKDLLDAKTIVMYGAGNQYKFCYSYIQSQSDTNILTVDGDISKWGTETPFGNQIISPDEINWDMDDMHIVIGTVFQQYEIARMIKEKYYLNEDSIYMYTSDWYEENVYKPELIEKKYHEIEKIADKLADEASRTYYLNSIEARIERQPLRLNPNENAKYGEYKDAVILKKGDCIIDCGAYIGDTTAYYMEKMDGDCTVHAIEPFDDNYNKLKGLIWNNNWNESVCSYNCAVGRVEEERELVFDDFDFGMAINLSKKSGKKRQRLRVCTLDGLFPTLHVDYIKMDIEGEENGALLGGQNLIERCTPRMMISAYHKIEDFWEIPNTIWDINNSYKIYVAHAPGVSTEMEYYCVVE